MKETIGHRAIFSAPLVTHRGWGIFSTELHNQLQSGFDTAADLVRARISAFICHSMGCVGSFGSLRRLRLWTATPTTARGVP